MAIEVQPQRMDCAHCAGQAGVFIDGAFLFRVRHNGTTHVNAITVEQIIKGIGTHACLEKVRKIIGDGEFCVIVDSLRRAA